MMGKLERTEEEHIGHLSANLVLSRYVTHQWHISHSIKIDGTATPFCNVLLWKKVVNYIL